MADNAAPARRAVLGLDVGKASHWACMLTRDGEVAVNRPVAVNVNPSFTDSTNAIAPIAPTHPRRFRRRQAPFPASRSGARSFVR